MIADLPSNHKKMVTLQRAYIKEVKTGEIPGPINRAEEETGKNLERL